MCNFNFIFSEDFVREHKRFVPDTDLFEEDVSEEGENANSTLNEYVPGSTDKENVLAGSSDEYIPDTDEEANDEAN